MPHFKECADSNDNIEKDRCTRKKIGEFIAENIVLPDFKKQKRPNGTVFVWFIVNREGGVYGVEILKGLHPKLDKAAIDVVKKLPEFIPGRAAGKDGISYLSGANKV